MSGKFHNQSWATRYGSMGDEAEGIFERVWPRNWERFGLKRPCLQVASLPLEIRYTPDYLTSFSLVEVQGFGRDGTLRVKDEKFAALKWWQEVMPVEFFLWDSTNSKWGTIDCDQLFAAESSVGAYDDGAKPFRAYKASDLPIEWTEFDAAEEMAA
jgi:hypothetical protein